MHRVAGGAFEHLGSASKTKERYRASERGQHDEPGNPPAYSSREAVSGKKALALETKRLEKQRQLDQQRSDIHPEPVQAALQVLAHHQAVTSVPAPTPTGLLPKAEPSEEAETAPVVHLQIRKRRSHDD